MRFSHSDIEKVEFIWHLEFGLGLNYISTLLKKLFSAGCSKMPRCEAPEILRSEAYLLVHCNDEG